VQNARINILIEVAEETVTEIEALKEKLKSEGRAKEPEVSMVFVPTLTDAERAEARKISYEKCPEAANAWLKELIRGKKKAHMDRKKALTQRWFSRRALIVRLIEVGLQHVDEV
jgi:sulfatase maturation enzyme AslB (radical SAM superfamily)